MSDKTHQAIYLGQDVTFYTLLKTCFDITDTALLMISSENKTPTTQSNTSLKALFVEELFFGLPIRKKISTIKSIANKCPIILISQDGCWSAQQFKELKKIQEIDYLIDRPLTPEQAQLLISCIQNKDKQVLLDHSDDLLWELKQNYKRNIYDKISYFETLILSIIQNISEESIRPLYMETHKIAGSAGGFGYLQAGIICRELSNELDSILKRTKDSPNTLEGLNKEDLIHKINKFFKNLKFYFQIV